MKSYTGVGEETLSDHPSEGDACEVVGGVVGY